MGTKKTVGTSYESYMYVNDDDLRSFGLLYAAFTQFIYLLAISYSPVSPLEKNVKPGIPAILGLCWASALFLNHKTNYMYHRI